MRAQGRLVLSFCGWRFRCYLRCSRKRVWALPCVYSLCSNHLYSVSRDRYSWPNCCRYHMLQEQRTLPQFANQCSSDDQKEQGRSWFVVGLSDERSLWYNTTLSSSFLFIRRVTAKEFFFCSWITTTPIVVSSILLHTFLFDSLDVVQGSNFVGRINVPLNTHERRMTRNKMKINNALNEGNTFWYPQQMVHMILFGWPWYVRRNFINIEAVAVWWTCNYCIVRRLRSLFPPKNAKYEPQLIFYVQITTLLTRQRVIAATWATSGGRRSLLLFSYYDLHMSPEQERSEWNISAP